MTDNLPNPIVNIGDLPGLSEPANTLIKKVSKAFGGFFKPWQIRRVAKAEADASVIKAKAEGEVAIIKAQTQIQITDYERNAMHRLVYEEAQRQKNMEDIAMRAISHLSENADPSKMDDDWVINYFDKARIISDSEMQELWSRILAGEANDPGSYSKRTVNALGDIDKNDAEIFMRLCCFCCTIDKYIVPLVFDIKDDIYVSNKVNFMSLSHLESIGLIKYGSFGGFKETNLPKRFSINYYGEQRNLTMKKDSDNELNVGEVLLTRVGEELAPICGSHPIDGFIGYIESRWARKKESGIPLFPSSDFESLT